jgi:hypothetical protein
MERLNVGRVFAFGVDFSSRIPTYSISIISTLGDAEIL